VQRIAIRHVLGRIPAPLKVGHNVPRKRGRARAESLMRDMAAHDGAGVLGAQLGEGDAGLETMLSQMSPEAIL
jgi:hypothetical protein